MSKGKSVGLWSLYYVLTFVITTVLVIIPDWTGDGSMSVEGDRIDDLMWGMIILSNAILAVVFATIIFALLHFRAGARDDEDGEPIHGHHKLEAVWTVIPAIIVTVLSVLSYMVLVDNEKMVEAASADQKDGVAIEVIGYQFGWDYVYPDINTATTTNFVLPAGKPALFQVTSRKYVAKADGSIKPDVVHSFWVPESRIKQDAVPGIWADIQFTPKRDAAGAYGVFCAELCGALHSQMLGEVCVVDEAEYDEWYAELTEAAEQEKTGAVSYPCGGDDATVQYRVFANDDEKLGMTPEMAKTVAEAEEHDGAADEEGH